MKLLQWIRNFEGIVPLEGIQSFEGIQPTNITMCESETVQYLRDLIQEKEFLDKIEGHSIIKNLLEQGKFCVSRMNRDQLNQHFWKENLFTDFLPPVTELISVQSTTFFNNNIIWGSCQIYFQSVTPWLLFDTFDPFCSIEAFSAC